jgi:hypothetical protein
MSVQQYFRLTFDICGFLTNFLFCQMPPKAIINSLDATTEKSIEIGMEKSNEAVKTSYLPLI